MQTTRSVARKLVGLGLLLWQALLFLPRKYWSAFPVRIGKARSGNRQKRTSERAGAATQEDDMKAKSTTIYIRGGEACTAKKQLPMHSTPSKRPRFWNWTAPALNPLVHIIFGVQQFYKFCATQVPLIVATAGILSPKTRNRTEHAFVAAKSLVKAYCPSKNPAGTP